MQVQSLGQEDPLEEGTETHSNIPAWRIPWMRGAWRATWSMGSDITEAAQYSTAREKQHFIEYLGCVRHCAES